VLKRDMEATVTYTRRKSGIIQYQISLMYYRPGA